MDLKLLLLIIAVIMSGLTTIGIWAIVFSLSKIKNAFSSQKAGIMRTIGEECAEADTILASAGAKAMNPHALRSALLPRVEKIRKLLSSNMHELDAYFVKYVESRIALFSSAYTPHDDAPVFPIDKFLADTKTKVAPVKVAEQPAVASVKPAVHTDVAADPMPRPAMPPAEKPAAKHLLPHADTAIFELRQRIESMPTLESMQTPPQTPLSTKTEQKDDVAAMDLRTGIISVVNEDTKAPVKPKEAAPLKPQAKTIETKPAAPASQKSVAEKPAPEKPKGVLAKPAAHADDVFDFEKEISTKVNKTAGTKQADETEENELHVEKTIKWDREELAAHAKKGDSIVVKDAEPVFEQKKAQAAQGAAPVAAASHPDDMISGEDIENTLDSFFGLGDK